MPRPSDEEVKDLVATLFEVGSPEADLNERELRYFCRSAARMIKDLQPDLSYAEPNGVLK